MNSGDSLSNRTNYRMVRLVKNLHPFEPQYFGTTAELIDSPESDVRDILMVACSDHGSAPDNVSFLNWRRMYVVQHLAESIPSEDASFGDQVLGGIEYAVQLMNVRHVIVCGHLDCKIIPRWAASGGGGSSNDFESRFNAQTQSAVRLAYPHVPATRRGNLLICEHILFQIENLQSHRFIQERLREGKLRLHGWLVDDSTAQVRTFNVATGQFVRPT